MSAESLKFEAGEDTIEIEMVEDQIALTVYNIWSDRANNFQLDRSQAHILKLWLEEHLK